MTLIKTAPTNDCVTGPRNQLKPDSKSIPVTVSFQLFPLIAVIM